MKIVPILSSNPAFCKRILNNTSVKTTDGKLESVNFVEYEPTDNDDFIQINKIENSWKTARFIEQIAKNFRDSCMQIFANDSLHPCCNRYYGIETKDGDTLSIAETFDYSKLETHNDNDNFLEINYIQTNPRDKYLPDKASKKRYKGLGEALVCEIVKLACTQKQNLINITSANEGFWKKSTLFKEIGGDDNDDCGEIERVLLQSDFDEYINYVEDKKTV